MGADSSLNIDSLARDPQFVDAAKGDYPVMDGSAALTGGSRISRWTNLAHVEDKPN